MAERHHRPDNVAPIRPLPRRSGYPVDGMTTGSQSGRASALGTPRRARQGLTGAILLVGLVAAMSWFDSSRRTDPDARAAGLLVDPTDVPPEGAGSPAPPSCVQPEPDGPVWELVFHDDFEGPSLDTVNWYPYDSEGNAGFGLRRPSAIAVQDGVLVITAQMLDGVLVSGGMSHQTGGQLHGRWEFRVRTDPDPSQATSGVVLTWPDSGDWPVDGESDMYETGTEPDRQPFWTFIHYGADNSQQFLTHDFDGTEWHEMAMEWTEGSIAMYVDGERAGEITGTEVVPDVAHHMTIQLDAWADTMGDPVRMEVDWVRVYRPAGSPGSAVGASC
jgi:beta-glucanase (GH16 family)